MSRACRRAPNGIEVGRMKRGSLQALRLRWASIAATSARARGFQPTRLVPAPARLLASSTTVRIFAGCRWQEACAWGTRGLRIWISPGLILHDAHLIGTTFETAFSTKSISRRPGNGGSRSTTAALLERIFPVHRSVPRVPATGDASSPARSRDLSPSAKADGPVSATVQNWA